MSYRTTCPRCTSVFRLGDDQLDAAEGWVQCGVCGAVFDARGALLREDGTPLSTENADIAIGTARDDGPAAPEDASGVPRGGTASDEPGPGEASAEPEPVPETTVPDPATGNASTDEAPDGADVDADPDPDADPDADAARSPEYAAGAARPDPATAPASPGDPAPHGIAQREADDGLPSIILIDPDASVDDDPGPLPHIPAPVYPRPDAAPAYPSAPSSDAPAARIEYAGRARVATASHPDARVRRRAPGAVWIAASGVLLLLLLAQTAYFLRDPLTSRFPEARPAFAAICAHVGCTLSLPKNLALLRIVGSDLQTEASGRLKLTLTLGNRAGHAQAWPVLVLTLMDQRNRPLARRSFAPSEYLGDPARIPPGIPPRSEQSLSLPLNVSEITPLGYDLRLSY